MARIFGEAVREVQDENRRLGVPNVYTINGVIHYELPDGTLTTEESLAGDAGCETAGAVSRGARLPIAPPACSNSR